MNWFHRPAAVTLCPSESYREVLRERGHEGPFRIWGRGVDADRFSPSHRSLDLRRRLAPHGETIVSSVGRLVPEKQVDRVLDAFLSATRAGTDPPSVLVVVGEGASRPALERRAPQCVVFLGALRGHALAETYASSDVFATASEDETFGNAVLEAMASGLPVVGPRAGALVELVDDACGDLVPTAATPSASPFARALRRMLLDDVRRTKQGGAARRAALARTWTKATDEILEGYALARRRERCVTSSEQAGCEHLDGRS
jgi:phosphatidylinositol alpha 1,6-mannosyltransferase